MDVSYKSDIGCARHLNEDRVLCVTLNIGSGSSTLSTGLFVVADGMGGHNAGEVASKLAIMTFLNEFSDNLGDFSDGNAGVLINNANSILKDMIDKANAVVYNEASSKELQGMGTTLTAALIIGQELFVAHVGDSRCYIINKRETLQVTRDHSVVQEMVDAGLITPDEARVHPIRNEITRALGCAVTIAPDIHHIRLYDEDTVLLCSDGLYNELAPREIAEIIVSSGNLRSACLHLVDQAKIKGGLDNISVALVRPEHLLSWDSLVSAQTQIDPREIDYGNDQGVNHITKIVNKP